MKTLIEALDGAVDEFQFDSAAYMAKKMDWKLNYGSCHGDIPTKLDLECLANSNCVEIRRMVRANPNQKIYRVYSGRFTFTAWEEENGWNVKINYGI